MARQRQLLNARLGLDMAAKMGIDVSDIVSNEDLIIPGTPDTGYKSDDTLKVSSILIYLNPS